MGQTAIIFGGSGYIGRNMLSVFLKEDRFSKYIVCDIKPLSGFEDENKVHFEKIDVRREIKIESDHDSNSWIFNFAAIHREPGHAYKEYFDTNIPGAENVTEFARKAGIKNIFFTSSIAPYGKSLEKRNESSTLYPETAYGISKALAERIHQEWLVEDNERRLIIVRPSVIFGPKDPGNVYRMIKALKKGTFVLPDGGKVIKAYGYIYGLVDSILFTMNLKDNFIVYNYAENPLIPLNEMTEIVKKRFDYNKPVLKISVKILSLIALFLVNFLKIIGKTTDIHPVRVRKAGFPTNIEPKFLIDRNFVFKYHFEAALEHWKEESPEDF
ncbi:NAD-dependent epimerase/dehydratase family protein [Flagellimonas sp.]|uniref:NAD-dependent epimerase/dehydratase family protein n=1 Tax=Flagellimonas sp. TaxID=2058762 RepID=UPI003B59D1A4